MGLFQIFSTLLSGPNRQADILVLGLDNSGKTTILNQLKPPDAQSSSITPTVGYSVEKFTAANINFSAFDMSGQSN
jgi:ADP-ribosylation factor-like protein 6